MVAWDDNARRRGLLEQELASRLNGRGAAAVTRPLVTPAEGDADHESIKREAREQRIRSVLIARLVSVDKRTHYISGQPMRYYGYFDPATGREYSPGTWDEVQIVRLKTKLYDLASETLIWSAASESLAPSTDEALAQSLGRAITDGLTKRGLLKQ